MSTTPPAAPVTLFIAHHEKDRELYKELRDHLKPRLRAKSIEIRDRDSVPVGTEWRKGLQEEMSAALVLVFLVSSHLLNEAPWWDLLRDAAYAADAGRQRLVPVMARNVDVSDTPLSGRKLLPREPHPPLDICEDRGGVWMAVAKEIGDVVQGALDRARPQPTSSVATAESAGAGIEDVRRRKERAYGLKYQGRGGDALAELRAALQKLDSLSAGDAQDPLLKKERAHLFERIAQCEYAQGRFVAARAAFDLAFDIRVKLYVSQPADTDMLFDLSTSRFWRGYLSYLRGDLTRARDEQQAGLEVCERLCERDRDNVKAARSLVVLQTDLGTTCWELGDPAGAERHLREALQLARELAERNPDNRQIHRDVSVGLFRLADLLAAQHRTEEATRLCEEAIPICWRLTEWDPTNVQWRRHLATARLSMGDVRMDLGDLPCARGDYEFAAGTMGALAALESDDRQGARHHARAEKKLGDLLDRAGDHKEATAAYARSLSAMKSACAGEPNERWQRELREIQEALSRVSTSGADVRVAT
jgi:tetratricopeptide (TPR) repeat protein